MKTKLIVILAHLLAVLVLDTPVSTQSKTAVSTQEAGTAWYGLDGPTTQLATTQSDEVTSHFGKYDRGHGVRRTSVGPSPDRLSTFRIRPTGLGLEDVEKREQEDQDVGKYLYDCLINSQGDWSVDRQDLEGLRLEKLGFDLRAQGILRKRGTEVLAGDKLKYEKAGDLVPVNISLNGKVREPKVDDYSKDELAILDKHGWLQEVTVKVIKKP